VFATATYENGVLSPPGPVAMFTPLTDVGPSFAFHWNLKVPFAIASREMNGSVRTQPVRCRSARAVAQSCPFSRPIWALDVIVKSTGAAASAETIANFIRGVTVMFDSIFSSLAWGPTPRLYAAFGRRPA